MRSASPTPATGPSPVLRGMRVAQHLLFAVLLVVGALRAVGAGTPPGSVAVAAGSVGTWYAIGALAPSGRRSRLARPWLAVLLLGWAALVVLSVEFSWLAFALFFVCLHLLPAWAAVAAVGVLTGAVVVAQATARGGLQPAEVLGPVIGAAVAVVMALAYRRLVEENEARRLLVQQLVDAHGELVATHEALAAAEREAGALAERSRLAGDIHDTLAQGFSSVLLLARAGLGSGDPLAALREVAATAADNLEEARRVVHALAPAALDDATLPAALERLLTDLGRRTGVRTTLRVDGDTSAAPVSAQVALLRLAQGALANVREHAAASRVAVTLTATPDDLTLDVVDDGRGFDPAALDGTTRIGPGFGLRAMRDRLAALGGRLVVESSPGDGTAVAATVPLGNAPA